MGKPKIPSFHCKGGLSNCSWSIVRLHCSAVATCLQCSTTRPYRAALTWCRAYSRAQWRIGRQCLAGCNSLQSVDIPHAWQVCTLYRLKRK